MQQFVKCMQSLLGESASSPEISSELVGLFSRINLNGQRTITFNDVSNFLMSANNDVRTDKYSFQYKESTQDDTTIHHNYIEKALYISDRDELVFFEQNMRVLRVYDPSTLTKKQEYPVSGAIFCLEYIDSPALIVVSLSTRDLLFIEPDDGSRYEKPVPAKLRCPDSTLTMKYVSRMGYLFTGGLTGAIYAWNIKLLKDMGKPGDLQSVSYESVLVEGFPWFERYEITHINDLPVIDSLAVGYSDGVVRIWGLKVSFVFKEIGE